MGLLHTVQSKEVEEAPISLVGATITFVETPIFSLEEAKIPEPQAVETAAISMPVSVPSSRQDLQKCQPRKIMVVTQRMQFVDSG